jgi:membrane associated rhomboid family serine protease
MFPIRDNLEGRRLPLVTYTLIALNVIIFLWDRQLNPFAPNIVFADLAMRPPNVMDALRPGGDQFYLVTVLTSMFLHGSLVHLIGNMLFLLTFGQGVEEALGPKRFTLYYLLWGIFAAAAQIFVDPRSPNFIVGASGAIGGVLGAYFLLFPGNKIEIVTPLGVWEVSAWIMLGVWFLWQILVPQQGVANWAHAGGFLAGMATILVLGGRERVFGGRKLEELDEGI